MIAISKNVYFDVLDDILNKYNNTVYTTIKMKPVEVTDDSYAEYNEDFNKKDPKFKVGDHVRISKYKNIFAKGYTPNWSEEVFVVSKIKNTNPWTYVINDLNGEEIIGIFYEKKLQKTNQEKFRKEKVLKRKGDKLYVKWKGYDNRFNSWIDIGYSGYGTGFDRRPSFSFPGGRFGQNVLIFGVVMSLYTHINNKTYEKDILVLGKGPTQGLEHTLTAEKMYSINFTVTKKINFVWAYITMEQIVACLWMVQKFINLR